MGAGLKKDLRVFRVGPRGSLNALFFFFPSELFLISQILAMVRKKGGNNHTWRVQYNRDMTFIEIYFGFYIIRGNLKKEKRNRIINSATSSLSSDC